MNRGITDLIQLIEKETSKPSNRKKKDYQEQRDRRRKADDKYSHKPKINKKSQRISDKIEDTGAEYNSNNRVLKGTYLTNKRSNKNEEDLADEYPEIEVHKEMKECTFTPEINSETYRITSNQEERDTFDHLYSQAKVINKQKEDLLKERKEKKINEEIGECTFKPNIGNINGENNDVHVVEHDDKIEERALKYTEEK
mmetsp:Transcript_12030/g.10629  ORF Transcript_12030/g.10629 Transcript_12030/m.10629 type:complete len:198 (+) Transcript_12030:11-604(+)